MAAKLIIRVFPDDRVQVKVEGFTELDQSKPKGKKLCEKITRRLEQDLGIVKQRTYDGESQQSIVLYEDEEFELDHG